jgi:hypothetical protein
MVLLFYCTYETNCCKGGFLRQLNKNSAIYIGPLTLRFTRPIRPSLTFNLGTTVLFKNHISPLQFADLDSAKYINLCLDIDQPLDQCQEPDKSKNLGIDIFQQLDQ